MAGIKPKMPMPMIFLDKPYQLNLRKLIGLFKSGVSFRPLRTKGKAFEQDCISVYHLEPYFCQQLSFTPRSEAEFLEEAKDLQT